MLLHLLYAACTRRVKASDAGKLLAFNMRCYTRVLIVCWKDKVSNQVIREKVQKQWKMMDLIKKMTTFWAHLQNGRPKTDCGCDVGYGRREQTMCKTNKNYDIADWHGCSLPEAVQVAKKRQTRERITGCNGSWLQRTKKNTWLVDSKSLKIAFRLLSLSSSTNIKPCLSVTSFLSFLMICDTAMSAVVTSIKNKQCHNTDINAHNKSRETISTTR